MGVGHLVVVVQIAVEVRRVDMRVEHARNGRVLRHFLLLCPLERILALSKVEA